MSAHTLTLETLTFGGLISQGWAVFKANWIKLLGVAVVVIILQVVLSVVQEQLTKNGNELLGGVIGIVGSIASTIIGMGWLSIYLKAVRGEEIEVIDVFTKYDRFFTYLFGNIMSGLVVMVGFLLLIVPGIIWAIKYMFVPYLIVDTQKGASASLEASGKMTDGMKLRLFFYGLGFLGYNLLGLLALGIGLLVTIPVTALAGTIMYDVLKNKLGESQPVSTPIATISQPETT